MSKRATTQPHHSVTIEEPARTRIKQLMEQLMANPKPMDLNSIGIEAIITVIEQRINSHRTGGYIGSRGMAEQIYRAVTLALWSSRPCTITDEQLQFVESITDQIIHETQRPPVHQRSGGESCK